MTILATLVYIIDENNKVLMLHRIKKENDIHQDKYNGLGGKIESGETPAQCAIREVREESGLEILDLRFKGHLLFPEFDKLRNDWFVFVYTARKFSGELIKAPPEGELVWVPKNNLLQLNLWEGDQFFIPDLFKDKTFDGSFHYKNGKLIDHQYSTIKK